MATALSLNQVVQTNHVSSFASQFAQLVRHWLVTAVGAPAATDDDFINSLDVTVANAMKNVLGSTARYEGAKVQIIRPIPFPAVIYIVNAGAGAIVGDMMSPQTAGLVRLRSAFGGKANRGRFYTPFPSENSNGPGGGPTAAMVTSMAALGNNFIAPFSVNVGGRTATLTPVIFHRVAGTTTPIINHQVQSVWATQRRRSFVNRADTNPLQP